MPSASHDRRPWTRTGGSHRTPSAAAGPAVEIASAPGVGRVYSVPSPAGVKLVPLRLHLAKLSTGALHAPSRRSFTSPSLGRYASTNSRATSGLRASNDSSTLVSDRQTWLRCRALGDRSRWRKVDTPH